MAGIAPVSGSVSTPAADAGGAPPRAPSSTPGQEPDRSDARGFTAFPDSYAGFGENGSSFGTVSVVGGKLAVVLTDATQSAPPAQQTVPAQPPKPAPDSQDAAAAHPGDADPQAPAPPIVTAAGAGPIPGAPAPPSAGLQPPSLDRGPDPGPVLPKPSPAQNDPAAGLLGGSTTGAPDAGFLGAPATNPIVTQAENQQRAAAAAAAAEANQAAAAQQADRIALQQINARIAAARAAGNDAAVAQLQPRRALVVGDLQNQTFAGLGSTPPKPFARPEIPTVFLNIAS